MKRVWGGRAEGRKGEAVTSIVVEFPADVGLNEHLAELGLIQLE